jgi:protein TonB
MTVRSLTVATVIAACLICPADLAAQSSGIKPPRKIHDVRPVYPQKSLQVGDEGWVLIEMSVAPSGNVSDVHVLGSSCAALNDAAVTAVRQWRFEPLVLNGTPTSHQVTATIPFRLPKKFKSRAGRPGACLWKDEPKPVH